jgi:serine protease Do
MLFGFNGLVVFSRDAGPSIIVNGRRIDSGGAFIENGTTYVPLRVVSEALGATVGWDGEARAVSIDLGAQAVNVAQLVGAVSPSVVAIVGTYQDRLAGGSGVVIRSGGDILTNAHVVDGLQNIIVVLHCGSAYNGRVRFFDEPSDLAVVRIDRIGLPIVTFAENEDIVAGETVIAIGTPLSFSLMNSATKGIISGLNRGVTGEYALIQTDASINSGNSGGPLVNLHGQVVGINSSKFAGVGIEGIGFAIPADTVRFVLDHFERYGEVRRAGINAVLEEGWAARRGLPTREGLRVLSSSGVSRTQGLQNDDVILAVGGTNVHSLVDFNMEMKMIKHTGNN